MLQMTLYDVMISCQLLGSAMAQWKSAWLETEGLLVRASPASLRCVLEQDTLILAYFLFNPEDPSRRNWINVDWDVKNQIKQPNKSCQLSDAISLMMWINLVDEKNILWIRSASFIRSYRICTYTVFKRAYTVWNKLYLYVQIRYNRISVFFYFQLCSSPSYAMWCPLPSVDSTYGG